MPLVERSVLVHYSAEQMFDLVADIEQYPRFLPWCSGTRVVPEHGGGLDASVDIDFRGIRSRFTTRNQLRYPEQIRMHLVEGPFRAMEGLWQFHPLRPGASKVQLLEIYAPRGVDPQTPHDRDEVYVVAAGRGTFVNGTQRMPCGPGDLLFAAAGEVHRFEDFSDDFVTWVLFYGPRGGERRERTGER